jgi:cytidylate kinase
MTDGLVIAVDGPAASGKGTVAARLGAAYGLPVLDTGLLYRAVGVAAARAGADPDDPAAAAAVARMLDLLALDDPAFRTREAGELASRVAVHPGVRAALKAAQVGFAGRPGGAVLDGRDIGTVIAPSAAGDSSPPRERLSGWRTCWRISAGGTPATAAAPTPR